MFEAFSRSWNLTKLSFKTIWQDKEMLLFPLLGGLFSLIFIVAVIAPALLGMDNVSLGTAADNALSYVLLFLIYLGLAVIGTFFNVCVVYTTKTRFEGGDATFTESIKFALSKLPLIFYWGLLSATVGMVMRALEQAAQRAGAAGEVIWGIINSLVGMVWGVVTLFVVPVMVFEGLTPFKAIKRSVTVLKDTWGESLIRHFGLGAIQALFMFLAMLLGIGLLMALQGLGDAGVIAGVVILIMLITLVVLVFNVANAVFNTALYVYANDGSIPGEFDQDTLAGSLGPRGQNQGSY